MATRGRYLYVVGISESILLARRVGVRTDTEETPFT